MVAILWEYLWHILKIPKYAHQKNIKKLLSLTQ